MNLCNTRRENLLIFSRSIVSKMRDNPDFGVAISAAVYESGQHQVDFSVTRHGDACCYVGFAVPSIDLDRSKCPPPIRNINFKALSRGLALFLARSGSGSRTFLFRRDSLSSLQTIQTLTQTPMPFHQLGAAVIPGVNAGITSAAA
jgi:hypothetical protein